MIINLINMNGYGVYVWSSFIFTLLSFLILYAIVNYQQKKEKEKFILRYSNLTTEKTKIASGQSTYKEILAFTSLSKI
tara:strand:- start:73 stop:306 length:234 start_codon:yes stop_codon:yes gene_type:complete